MRNSRAVKAGLVLLLAVNERPQQGAGEAGGTASAVDAEFGAGEGLDGEAGGSEAGVGGGVFFEGDQAMVAEGEDVAG